MADMQLEIGVVFNDKGLDEMRNAFKSLSNLMNDMKPPAMAGKRTVYGQMSADVRSLGRAAETAAPKLDNFAKAMRKFDHRAVNQGMNQIERVADKTRATIQGLITAQRSLNQNLNDSSRFLRDAQAGHRAYAAAQAASAKQTQANAAQTRASAAVEANAVRERIANQNNETRLAIAAGKQNAQLAKQQAKNAQNVAKSQREAGNAAAAMARKMISAFQSVLRVVQQLAQMIRSTLTAAIRSAGTALSSFGTSAAARFATLRTQLDAASKAFLRLRDNSRSAGNAFQQMWSGDALIRTGRNLMQFVHQGQMLLRQTYTQFAGVEQSISRAAVAGIDPIYQRDAAGNPTGVIEGFTPINMEEMWEFVYGTQRGQYGNAPIRSLTTQELADSIYYLTSAIGVGPTTDENRTGIANMVGPMAIWASATQTSPEEFIKGVLGIGQQFGFNPRDFEDANTAQAFSGISGMVGYLANVSSMEPSDVIAGMRMVGPSAFNAFGGMDAFNAGDTDVRERAMFDTFLAMFAASETGLRGSQVGRGYQRLFSGFADATPKTRALIMEALGLENTEQGYKDWLYDDDGRMWFGGNGEGVLGIANFLRDFKAENGLEEYNDLIYGLFTENATRAMASTIGGMDSGMFDLLQKTLESGDFDLAYKLLEQVMEQETALISNAVTNMANAWGQFANSIFRTSNDMIISGLDTIANVFRELSDIIMTFPSLGKMFTGAFSIFMVGGGLIAGLLMTAGTLVSLNRALSLIGISAGIVSKAILAIPLALMRLVPMLFLAGAAAVALKTAWDNNFLGMRDSLTGLYETLNSGDLSEHLLRFLNTDGFMQFYTWIQRIKMAFSELISGILFNVGGTNNLGAMLYHIFGQQLGSYFYENLLRARTALIGFREELSGLFSDLGGSITQRIQDLGKLFVGLLEVMFTGRLGARGRAGADAIGEWLGLENFSETFTNFATGMRQNLQAFGSIVAAVFGDIRDNLSDIFTMETFTAALRGAGQFLRGFAQGMATAFLGALKTIELVTEALSKIGGAGSHIRAIVKDITGLEMTFDRVAQTLGVVAGLFVGSRILAPLLVFNDLIRRSGVLVLGFGLQLASMAGSLLAAVAGFGVLGGALAVVMVVIGGVLAALYGYTAATEGIHAANEGLISTWNGIKDVLTDTIQNIVDFGKAIVNLALDISGVSDSAITFESIGTAIGNVLSTIAYVVTGAVSGLVLLGAALFRIGREYGPAVVEALRQIAPMAASIGVGIAAGLAGAVVAVLELIEVINSIGPVAWGVALAVVAAIYFATHPIAAVVLAISAIGLAFLAITSDAESMSSNVAGIVETLPEPWQAAADKIILMFAKVFDFIQSGGDIVGKSFDVMMGTDFFSGYSYNPQDSFELQYLESRGQLTPQHVIAWRGGEGGWSLSDDEMAEMGWHNRSGGGAVMSDSDPNMRAKRETLPWMYDSMGVVYERDGYIPHTYEEFLDATGTPIAPAYQYSDREFQQMRSAYLRDDMGSDVDRVNQFNAIFNPNQTALGLEETGDGGWRVITTGQTAQESFGGFSFNHPILDIMRFGGGSKSGTASTGPEEGATSLGWIETALNLPAGTFKTQEDLTSYLTSDVNNIPRFSEITGISSENINEYLADLEAWDKYDAEVQRLVSSGYTQQEAMDMVDFNYMRAGLEIPEPPKGLDEWMGLAAEMEDASYALQQANKQLRDAILQMSDPFAMTASHFDFMMGRGQLGGSGASYLTSNFDAVSGAVGESEWWNQYEYMADAAGLGFLGEDMYGVDAHEALRPLFERIERETGVAYSDLVADIPRWFAPEPIVAIAGQEIFSAINELDTDIYNALDSVINWEDFIMYAASQTAAGNEWDIGTYLRDSLGWSQEQIDAAFPELDFSVIGDGVLEGSRAFQLSMSEGMDIIDQSTWEAVEKLRENHEQVEGFLFMTEEQFNSLSSEEKRVIEMQGFSIVLQEPEIEPVEWTVEDAHDTGAKLAKEWGDNFNIGFNDTWGNTDVPVVTGLPHAGSGDAAMDQVIRDVTIDYILEPIWNHVGGDDPFELPDIDFTQFLPKEPEDIFHDIGVNINATPVVHMMTVNDMHDVGGSVFDLVSEYFTDEAIYDEVIDIKINFRASFGGDNFSGEGGMDVAAEGMAAQFVSSFVGVVSTQLPAALNAVLGSVSTEGISTNLSTILGEMQIEDLVINVTLDPSQATAAMAVTEEHIRSIVDAEYIVNIGADTSIITSAIEAVYADLMFLVGENYIVTIAVEDYASSVIDRVSNALQELNGKVATTTIRTVREEVFTSGSGLGGWASQWLATGGIVAGSDYQVVGEEGPELVKLPWGSRVYPHEESMRMLQSNQGLTRSSNLEISDRKVDTPVLEIRSSGSNGNDQPSVQISIGDVTISGDQDIDELLDKIDYEWSKRNGHALRGQASIDFRSYDD